MVIYQIFLSPGVLESSTMGGPMKKAYTKPALVVSGLVVPETTSGVRSGSELAQPLLKFNMT